MNTLLLRHSLGHSNTLLGGSWRVFFLSLGKSTNTWHYLGSLRWLGIPFFPYSLDGTEKVVPLSFPNLGMPLHFPCHGNEEGQPTLILLHSWAKLRNFKTLFWGILLQIYTWSKELTHLETNQSSRNQIIMYIQNGKVLSFNTWVNILNSQDNQLWKRTLKLNVYFLTKNC